MTPHNIFNMAQLKGLDIIGVTDHNAADNLPYMEAAAALYGLLLIPGIEVTTKEEVHLLGYFPSVKNALKAGSFFKSRLPQKQNNPTYFGTQIVYNLNDQPVMTEEALLIGATDQSILQCCDCIYALGGVTVPAHINRGANGMLTNLGFLPDKPGFKTIEISSDCLINENATTGKYILHSSDAHSLGMISEADHAMILREKSIDAVLAVLSGKII